MNQNSYIYDLVKSHDDIDHFGIDHLEVTFKACSDIFMTLSEKYFSDKGQQLFSINEKSTTEYPFYFEICRGKGYEKKILFKYNFK